MTSKLIPRTTAISHTRKMGGATRSTSCAHEPATICTGGWLAIAGSPITVRYVRPIARPRRYWSKMRLLLGLCAKITQATGADQIPAVKETLGRTAQEAMIAAMVNGQINALEDWPDGYVCFNRHMMYAALEWSTQNYSRFIDELRELSGGGVFQMPADISVLNKADLARDFQTYWHTPQCDAVTRMKLFKLAWDLVGSEFAGRHQQYEKFYAGAPFIVRGHSFRETDWTSFKGIVERLMDSYDCERRDSTAT